MDVPKRKRIVLLDLEGTIIDDWSRKDFLHYNIDRIIGSNVITPDTKVGLMSWAICNEKDADVVRRDILGHLKTLMNVNVDESLPLTMEDYGLLVLQSRGLKVSLEDMYDIFKKEEILLSLARSYKGFEGCEIILIDDVVDHGLAFNVPSTNVKVRFINIKHPVDYWLDW